MKTPLRILALAALALAPFNAAYSCLACGVPHAVLIANANSPAESSALTRFETDLSSLFKVFTFDFKGDDSGAVAKLGDAKLLVIAATPAAWPDELVTELSGYLDRGGSMLVLDMDFAAKSPASDVFWRRLTLAFGCEEAASAPASLFRKGKQPASHPVLRGTAPAALESLSPTAPPRHLLSVIARGGQNEPLAWLTAYQARPPATRFGNVAVVPLNSTLSLSSPEVRRLVLHAAMAASDNEDLIPSAGMKVVP